MLIGLNRLEFDMYYFIHIDNVQFGENKNVLNWLSAWVQKRLSRLKTNALGNVLKFHSSEKVNCYALSIVQKAQFFGVKIVFVENVKVHFSENSKSIAPKYDEQLVSKIVKVRELKPPFIKIVDRSGRYRPFVAETKDWPVDPLKMFSQGPDVLDDKPIQERKISYCELCEIRFSNLETHLKSCQHKKNAGDSKIWERVDALISRGPTLKQLRKVKLKQFLS